MSPLDAGDVVPELVPARMVNEFCYCPRLFHLEWVHAQFADNLDTVDGRWQHRAVDEPGGAVPHPSEGEVRVARSVQVSSERLGLVAKIDLLEGVGDGEVVPVDTKRGTPPDIPERAWEPERVQLCVQGLLLREQGWKCERGCAVVRRCPDPRDGRVRRRPGRADARARGRAAIGRRVGGPSTAAGR